jgi:ABC-type lipoprotein export system ATPase subunit
VSTGDAGRLIGVLRQTKNTFRALKGSDSEQLLCLVHGPGGSGKSRVINLVQAYAKSYCEELNHPYTLKTIIMTAMSGVEATLLHGETFHSVFALN